MSLTDKFLQAMDIVVDQKLAESNRDVTVEAVVQAKNAATGKYSVLYNGQVFNEIPAIGDYESGDSILMLIANGDFTKEKTILRAIEKTNDKHYIGEDDSYEQAVGEDFATFGENIELSSNSPRVLWRESGTKLFNINIEELRNLIDLQRKIQIQLNFSVNSQESSPDYDLNYGLNFYFGTTEEIDDGAVNSAWRKYSFSINDVLGNPYSVDQLMQNIIIPFDSDTDQIILKRIDAYINNEKYTFTIHNISIYGSETINTAQPYEIIFMPSSTFIINEENDEVEIKFCIKEKGAKLTNINEFIGPDDFIWSVTDKEWDEKNKRDQEKNFLIEPVIENKKKKIEFSDDGVITVTFAKANFVLTENKLKCSAVITNKNNEHFAFSSNAIIKMAQPELKIIKERIKNTKYKLSIENASPNAQYYWTCQDVSGNYLPLGKVYVAESSEIEIDQALIVGSNIVKCSVYTAKNGRWLDALSLTLYNEVLSVDRVQNFYYASTANTSQDELPGISEGIFMPTDDWKENPGDLINKFSEDYPLLWTFEKTFYKTPNDASGEPSPSITVPIVIGRYGVDGVNGIDGRGIDTITDYYQYYSDANEFPVDKRIQIKGETIDIKNWKTTMPSLDDVNKYLWNCEVIKYTDNTYKITEPRMISGLPGDTPTVEEVAIYCKRIDSNLSDRLPWPRPNTPDFSTNSMPTEDAEDEDLNSQRTKSAIVDNIEYTFIWQWQTKKPEKGNDYWYISTQLVINNEISSEGWSLPKIYETPNNAVGVAAANLALDAAESGANGKGIYEIKNLSGDTTGLYINADYIKTGALEISNIITNESGEEENKTIFKADVDEKEVIIGGWSVTDDSFVDEILEEEREVGFYSGNEKKYNDESVSVRLEIGKNVIQTQDIVIPLIPASDAKVMLTEEPVIDNEIQTEVLSYQEKLKIENINMVAEGSLPYNLSANNIIGIMHDGYQGNSQIIEENIDINSNMFHTSWKNGEITTKYYITIIDFNTNQILINSNQNYIAEYITNYYENETGDRISYCETLEFFVGSIDNSKAPGDESGLGFKVFTIRLTKENQSNPAADNLYRLECNDLEFNSTVSQFILQIEKIDYQESIQRRIINSGSFTFASPFSYYIESLIEQKLPIKIEAYSNNDNWKVVNSNFEITSITFNKQFITLYFNNVIIVNYLLSPFDDQGIYDSLLNLSFTIYPRAQLEIIAAPGNQYPNLTSNYDRDNNLIVYNLENLTFNQSLDVQVAAKLNAELSIQIYYLPQSGQYNFYVLADGFLKAFNGDLAQWQFRKDLIKTKNNTIFFNSAFEDYDLEAHKKDSLFTTDKKSSYRIKVKEDLEDYTNFIVLDDGSTFTSALQTHYLFNSEIYPIDSYNMLDLTFVKISIMERTKNFDNKTLVLSVKNIDEKTPFLSTINFSFQVKEIWDENGNGTDEIYNLELSSSVNSEKEIDIYPKDGSVSDLYGIIIYLNSQTAIKFSREELTANVIPTKSKEIYIYGQGYSNSLSIRGSAFGNNNLGFKNFPWKKAYLGNFVFNESGLSTTYNISDENEFCTTAINSKKYIDANNTCAIEVITNGEHKFYVRPTGELFAQSLAGASAAQTSSDINKKHEINLLNEVHNQIFDKLQPRTYKYNDGSSDRTHIGFIAQEVAEAVESSGLTTKDFAAVCYDTDKDGNKVDWTVRYGEIVALNTWQIQNLKKQVAELEDKIQSLSSQQGQT